MWISIKLSKACRCYYQFQTVLYFKIGKHIKNVWKVLLQDQNEKKINSHTNSSIKSCLGSSVQIAPHYNNYFMILYAWLIKKCPHCGLVIIKHQQHKILQKSDFREVLGGT